MMLSGKFAEALAFAHWLHDGQVRKSTNTPYISHLLSVTALVLEDGGSEEEAIAALLHDAVEDAAHKFAGGREEVREVIGQRFGPVVLGIVNDCTDDDLYPDKEVGRQDHSRWRERKESYIRHVAGLDEASRRVSCADKLHNVRSIITDYRREGDEVWKRFRTECREDQLWYYDGLVRAFLEASSDGRMESELKRAVEQLHKECGAGDSAAASN